MSRQIGVDQQEWTRQVPAALPQLSQPPVVVLALFRRGMVFARAGARSAVTAFLAAAREQPNNTVRQRRREFWWDAAAKAGAHRHEITVESCFVPLLRGMVGRWPGSQLALARDATTRGERCAVLAISVVSRGGALPVAGTIRPAGEKRAGRREWLRLLRLLHPAVPPSWTVLVLADRGRSARWLFRRIVRVGWPPFRRINTGGTFRPTDQAGFRPWQSFVPPTGTTWRRSGTAIQSRECARACTLLARWEDGHPEPGLILPARPPASCDPWWDGRRRWSERGFKRTQRGGWPGQATRMTEPERAARWWWVVAVATVWLVRGGGAAEAQAPESALADLTTALPDPTRQRRATRLRLVAVFQQGLIRLVRALLDQTLLPCGQFFPEPWPTAPPLTITDLPEETASQ
jgi:hypothetical protein